MKTSLKGLSRVIPCRPKKGAQKNFPNCQVFEA
jgi:hypothetical protein